MFWLKKLVCCKQNGMNYIKDMFVLGKSYWLSESHYDDVFVLENLTGYQSHIFSRYSITL